MTNISKESPRTPKGRPRLDVRLQARTGVRLEHHVLEAMTKGRSPAQIAASLGISIDTLRRSLRRAGFRIQCQYGLVPIVDASRPGQSPDRPDSSVAGAG